MKKHKQSIQRIQQKCFSKLITWDFSKETNFISIDEVDNSAEII